MTNPPAREIPALIESALRTKPADTPAPTMNLYAQTMGRFYEYSSGSLHYGQVTLYLKWRRDQKVKRATLQAEMSAIKFLYRHAVEHGACSFEDAYRVTELHIEQLMPKPRLST